MIASSMRFCCLAYGLLLLRWQHFGPFSVLDWKNVLCLWVKNCSEYVLLAANALQNVHIFCRYAQKRVQTEERKYKWL